MFLSKFKILKFHFPCTQRLNFFAIALSCVLLGCTPPPPAETSTATPKPPGPRPITVSGYEIENSLTGEIVLATGYELRGLVGTNIIEESNSSSTDYELHGGIVNE